jgi:protein TonB
MMPAEHPQIRNFLVVSLLVHLVFVGLLSVMQWSAKSPANRPLQVRIIDSPVQKRISPLHSRRMPDKPTARAQRQAKKLDRTRPPKQSRLARLKAAPPRTPVVTPPAASPAVAQPSVPAARHAALTPWVPPAIQTSPDLAATPPSPKMAQVEPLEGEGNGRSTRSADLRGQMAMLWKSLDAQQYPDRSANGGEAGDSNSSTGPTVSLDSQDSRFASYLLGVKRRIESIWSYPSEAKGVTGNLIVTFGITRDGRLSDLELTQTSGIAPLDNEAIRAIRQATPFSPFPERMHFERLNIRAAFYYHVSRTSFKDR